MTQPIKTVYDDKPCSHCGGPLHLHSDEGGVKIFRCKHCFNNPSPPNLIVGYQLRYGTAKCPTYAHDGDAGADLYAVSFENVAWKEPFNECLPPVIGEMCDAHEESMFHPNTDKIRMCPIILHPGRAVLVHTELSMVLPKGWEASIRGRSGLAFKHGIVILHIGTGDSVFTGKYDVMLKNESGVPFEIKPGDRIAQVVFAPVGRAAFQQKEMPATERGAKGYGSSGK